MGCSPVGFSSRSSSLSNLREELEEWLGTGEAEEDGLGWEGLEGRGGAEEQLRWSFLGRLRSPEESCS